MRKIIIIAVLALLLVPLGIANARWVDYWDVYPYYDMGCHTEYSYVTCVPPESTVTCKYFFDTQACCCEGLLWVPDAPTNITTKVSGNTITITWKGDSAATEYRLWWDDDAVISLGSDNRFITKGTSFTHKNLKYNQKYYYYLQAIGKYGRSGTDFNATTGNNPNPNPGPPAPPGALYRYFGNGEHFYTTSWNELGSGRSGYRYEGVQCYIFTSQSQGTIPLYRYYGNGDHFYTTNWNEIGSGRYGYRYEGVQGYVYPSKKASTVPLYRYYGNGDHFYTTNWNELGGGRAGYSYEGIQCYVKTTP